MVPDFYRFADADYLTEDQKALLFEISGHFNPKDNAADMSILYETTGFKVESDNL